MWINSHLQTLVQRTPGYLKYSKEVLKVSILVSLITLPMWPKQSTYRNIVPSLLACRSFILLTQNYFSFDVFYLQVEGAPMGSTFSPLLVYGIVRGVSDLSGQSF